MAKQIKARIIESLRLTLGYHKLLLSAEGITQLARPGQFINIKVCQDYEPLLRRPFSIHRIKDAYLEIIFKIVGKATELLSKKDQGDYLDIIGPLGKGFWIFDSSAWVPILVGGGIGIAPLLFLGEYLKHLGFLSIVLIGAKKKDEILAEEDFRRIGCKVKVSTEDGSRGFKGKVTDLLIKVLKKGSFPKEAIIYACGPRRMLEEINLISKRYRVSAQVSLEEHMACGIGACFGCVVNTRDGYKRVCKDGPVFNIDEIVWNNL
ncbi:MAG: dihydroorotate dehydrogenase electron transfer subunit [Candidatus Omnitrophica bacterium]|nr:dihydroorotate dehydrogenase electron transfer subunit [Candidatus Omnitrophota bacterium]